MTIAPSRGSLPLKSSLERKSRSKVLKVRRSEPVQLLQLTERRRGIFWVHSLGFYYRWWASLALNFHTSFGCVVRLIKGWWNSNCGPLWKQINSPWTEGKEGKTCWIIHDKHPCFVWNRRPFIAVSGRAWCDMISGLPACLVLAFTTDFKRAEVLPEVLVPKCYIFPM